jgi:mRNA-degrading endonuclease RelE of RelBE toxin-antitoxin system
LKSSNGSSGIGKWTITRIARTAAAKIESLDPELQEQVLLRLDELQANPYQGDVKKIQGKFNIYRLRIGEYRLYFRLIPESRTIETLLFESRGAIKKKTIQRLT